MKLITSTSCVLDTAVENQSPSSEDAQAANPLERVYNQHKIANHKIESFYKYLLAQVNSFSWHHAEYRLADSTKPFLIIHL